jgi:arginyl-tRNA synthetase
MGIAYFEVLKVLKERFGFGELDRTENPEYGDYYTNIAFKMAKEKRKPPVEIAQELSKEMRLDGVEVLPVKGYINFRVEDGKLCEIVNNFAKGIELKKDLGKRVLVEFISANPTGPLNVANARAGAVGDTIVKILKFLGFSAESEYYVNDCGSQIINLALSVLHKIDPEKYPFPEDGYRGEYIEDLAKEFKGEKFEDLEEFGRRIAHRILDWQKDTLKRYGINFDRFVLESEIRKSEYPDMVLRALKEENLLYESDGALYFKSTNFRDDKDRVLIRSNGEPTYFFWDSAYHLYKLLRGYDFIVDIFGPDHHGYVPRMRAMVQALKEYYKLNGEYAVIINGQVNLMEGGEKLRMSKREGRIYTLDELLDEVGRDAVRFFMLLRSPSSELNFDISLAKKLNVENPVYYVQYAHARIKSLLDYASSNGISDGDIRDLQNEDERRLARAIQFFPYYLLKTLPLTLREEYLFGKGGISSDFLPNLLVDYLMELAGEYHGFYQRNRIVGDKRQRERLRLSIAVMNILKTSLELLGVSAPERMG